MAKPDLGSKQKCQNCGTKFFDLNKDPVLCPKCGTTQAVAGPAVSARAAVREQASNDDEETETETGAEVMSLDDADQQEDGKVAAVNPEEDVDVEEDENAPDDDDTFLEEEDDDDGDVSDLIDGDIEEDEER